MTPETTRIDKILVVLDAEPAETERMLDSRLLERAVSVAKTVGCRIELFSVTYDRAAEAMIVTAPDGLQRMRQDLADRDAVRLAEIAAWLTDQGVPVEHEARWDSPRTDAILRKIADSKPDVVMKSASVHGYVLGLTSHTDWELARRSPAHVWLVNDDAGEIRRIVAAVGNTVANPDDGTAGAEVEVVRTAVGFGKAFEAEVDLVNAYRALWPASTMAPVDPAGGVPNMPLEDATKAVEELVRRHRRDIRELATRFGIGEEHLHVEEGDAEDVIVDVTRSVAADLVIMGSRNLNRLERFLTPVTVEPVMADAGCDVFVMREPDEARLPDTSAQMVSGTADVDLVEAIVNPQAVFSSPLQVAMLEEVSVELRRRILQAWEYDIRAAMVEENEGGLVGDIDADALGEIEAAKAALESTPAA